MLRYINVEWIFLNPTADLKKKKLRRKEGSNNKKGSDFFSRWKWTLLLPHRHCLFSFGQFFWLLGKRSAFPIPKFETFLSLFEAFFIHEKTLGYFFSNRNSRGQLQTLLISSLSFNFLQQRKLESHSLETCSQPVPPTRTKSCSFCSSRFGNFKFKNFYLWRQPAVDSSSSVNKLWWKQSHATV